MKRIYVGVGLNGDVGKAIDARLGELKAQIEQELGYHLIWEPGDISIVDDGVAIWDVDDWTVQHDWLGDPLEDFLRVFKVRVESLENEVIKDPELQRKIAKREVFTLYWKVCAKELGGSFLQFRESDLEAGRTYCRFNKNEGGIKFGVQYYSDGPWLCVYFGVTNTVGRRIRSLIKDLGERNLAELEGAIGQKLEWVDFYISASTAANISEASDWVRQHKWVRDCGEKLSTELSKRLELD